VFLFLIHMRKNANEYQNVLAKKDAHQAHKAIVKPSY